MQWVVWFLIAYIWVTATTDWGWNGWAAFFFAVVCAGVVMGIWQAIFGKGMVDSGVDRSGSTAQNEKGSSITDTALKMGAGYGIAKLTSKKTYAYQCKSCNHYEERSQERINAKCPRCGTGWMKVRKA